MSDHEFFHPEKEKLILLGVGQVAFHVAALAHMYKLIGTTRNKNKSDSLQKANITPFIIDTNFSQTQQSQFSHLVTDAYLLVTFPPDKHSDKLFSSLCSLSKKIIYISSTSVYGDYSGIVNETTKTDGKNVRSHLRLEAEKYWLDKGASILRAPGLYGTNYGLHLRLSNGSYRLPAKNDNYVSRIHLHDLARIILAAFAKPLPAGSINLVGDLRPATQIEVIQWLCQKMNLPMPSEAKADQIPQSLKANRRIEAIKILDQLGLQLQFPNYQDGYLNCLKESALLSTYDG